MPYIYNQKLGLCYLAYKAKSYISDDIQMKYLLAT